MLCVNGAKFAVLARNDQLVEIAEQLISSTTAKVYRNVLDKLEPGLRACKNRKSSSKDEGDADQHVVTTQDIVDTIPESEHLRDAIGNVPEDDLEDELFEHPKKRRRKTVNGSSEVHNGIGVLEISDPGTDSDIFGISDDENEEMANADFDPNQRAYRPTSFNPHHRAVHAHLSLLAKHPWCFLTRVPPSLFAPESWTVEYSSLVKHMQTQEIGRIICHRYGIHSVRLVQILAEHGKVNEETLAKFSLTKEKEMRARLTTLQKAGMIELQEVPKDSARAPARTTFLFFFNHERCIRNLTEECYKSMTRILQRAKVEREAFQSTIDKASRSDVVGKEEQLLSQAEREALQQWKSIEEQLSGQVGRIDDTVALLRDF